MSARFTKAGLEKVVATGLEAGEAFAAYLCTHIPPQGFKRTDSAILGVGYLSRAGGRFDAWAGGLARYLVLPFSDGDLVLKICARWVERGSQIDVTALEMRDAWERSKSTTSAGFDWAIWFLWAVILLDLGYVTWSWFRR